MEPMYKTSPEDKVTKDDFIGQLDPYNSGVWYDVYLRKDKVVLLRWHDATEVYPGACTLSLQGCRNCHESEVKYAPKFIKSAWAMAWELIVSKSEGALDFLPEENQ